MPQAAVAIGWEAFASAAVTIGPAAFLGEAPEYRGVFATERSCYRWRSLERETKVTAYRRRCRGKSRPWLLLTGGGSGGSRDRCWGLPAPAPAEVETKAAAWGRKRFTSPGLEQRAPGSNHKERPNGFEVSCLVSLRLVSLRQ